MTSLKRFGLATAALLFAAVTLLGATPASFAQQESGGSGVQVSPTRTEIAVNPGERKTVTITVKNVTQGPIVVQPEINDFESDNESGKPRIIVDPKIRSDYTIREFLGPMPDFELAANQVKDFEVVVAPSKDTAPGGYFGALRFVAVPKSRVNNQTAAERQVALTASVASLLLVQVNGAITESIKIEQIEVLLNGQAGGFFTKPPTQALVRIANTGNSFVKPFGKVSVNKGNKEVFNYELNNQDPRSNVLPGSSRNFRDDIKNIGGFGKFTVSANISANQGGEVLSVSKSFWLVPLWMLLAAGGLAAALLLAVIFLMIKRRRG